MLRQHSGGRGSQFGLLLVAVLIVLALCVVLYKSKFKGVTAVDGKQEDGLTASGVAAALS